MFAAALGCGVAMGQDVGAGLERVGSNSPASTRDRVSNHVLRESHIRDLRSRIDANPNLARDLAELRQLRASERSASDRGPSVDRPVEETLREDSMRRRRAELEYNLAEAMFPERAEARRMLSERLVLAQTDGERSMLLRTYIVYCRSQHTMEREVLKEFTEELPQ